MSKIKYYSRANQWCNRSVNTFLHLNFIALQRSKVCQNENFFLTADMQLYKRLCLFICWSVGLSVRWSVGIELRGANMRLLCCGYDFSV